MQITVETLFCRSQSFKKNKEKINILRRLRVCVCWREKSLESVFSFGFLDLRHVGAASLRIRFDYLRSRSRRVVIVAAASSAPHREHGTA